MKVTNTAAGPRGVNLEDGTTRFLDPGETADLDGVKASDLYDGLVEASREKQALDKMNKADLLALANDSGVTAVKDADGNDVVLADATKAQLIDAIEAARAA